jgi:hypothetical protein
MKSLKSVHAVAIAFGILLVIGVVGFALAMAETKDEEQEVVLSVYPLFSSALDGPQFRIELVNNSPEEIDWKNEEMIVLDGKEYPRSIWKGTPPKTRLSPGKTYSTTLDVGAFLPGSKKGEYSKKLKRWRWITPLKSGTHTIIIKLGSYKSASLKFIWDGDSPLLYQ